MQPNQFPLPIHIVSNGDPLHAIVLDRVAADHETTMSVADNSSDDQGQGSRAKRWAIRQLELDGPTGLVRDAFVRARPGIRHVGSRVNAKRNARRSRSSDVDFMRLMSVTPHPPTTGRPHSVGTLVSFTKPRSGSIAGGIEYEQVLYVHLGWPCLPNRDGVLSALTHRNVDALCAVVEAVGPISGFATGRPPLGRDDDPDRIHQRIVALAAGLLADVLRSPATELGELAPTSQLTTPLVDRQAVARDARSGRLQEVIASVARF